MCWTVIVVIATAMVANTKIRKKNELPTPKAN